MAFMSALDDIYSKLKELTKKIETNKLEPFNTAIIDLLEIEINKFYAESRKTINRYSEFEKNNKKSFEELLLKHKNDLNVLNKQYYQEIEKINSEIKIQFDELNEKNNKIKNELRNKTTENDLETSYLKNKNEQNILIFKSEYDNSISRFDYQLENAKVAYNESIQYYNKDLSEKIKVENIRYESDLIEYDQETENITDRYNDRIDDANLKLNNYVSKFNAIQVNQKDTRYSETVDLNNKIRNLANITNRKILAERIDYSKDQNVNRIEHDMKKRERLLSAQQTSKDFVLNMDKLNSKTKNMKEVYNTKKSEIEKELQFNLLENHKNLENEIKELSDYDYNKKRKKLEKNYYSVNKIEKNKTKNELIKIEKEFLKNDSTNTYSKKILDLNRSYDLKINNEIENADNKYFQELNNIDENDFSYKTKIHNATYKINANIVKLENAIKTLKTDSEYEKENLMHNIEIQKLSNTLKILRLELSSLIDIQYKVHETEKKKHDKCIKYLTIYNLLEVEKCKTLAEFNQRNYDRNVSNAKMTFETTKKNIDIQNEQNDFLNKLSNEYETIEADKKITYNNNKIDIIKETRDNKIKILDRKLLFDSEELSNKLFFERFNLDLKIINELGIIYIKLITELHKASSSIIDLIFDRIKLRPEYVDDLRDFNQELFNFIYEYYMQIGEDFSNIIKKLIDDKNQFEKSFKYESNYNELMIEFNAKFEELYEKKNDIEESINSINNEIELKNQTIFTVKNQLILLKNHYPYDKGNNVRKTYTALRQQQKKNKNELLELLNQLNILNAKLVDIEEKIKVVRIENEKKENEIALLQQSGSIPYFILNKAIHNIFLNINNTFKNRLFKIDEEIDAINYERLLNEKSIEIRNYNTSIANNIFEATNKFFSSSKFNFDKMDKINLIKYGKDLEKISNDGKEIINDLNDKIMDDNNNFNNKLNNVIKRKNEAIKYYNALIKKLDSQMAISSKKSIILKEKTEQQFYSEFYAIGDNQTMIVEDYNKTIDNYDIEFNSHKNNILTNLEKTKIKLSEELNKQIVQKDEYLKELPEKIKLQEISLTNEMKETNKNIQKQKVQDRADYFALRHECFKNLSDLQFNYKIKLKNINSERKSKLRYEKKKYSQELRHI